MPRKRKKLEAQDQVVQQSLKIDEIEHLSADYPDQFRAQFTLDQLARTPDLERELQALDDQLRSIFQSLKKMAYTGATAAERMPLEGEFWRLCWQIWETMEQRGSVADKQWAKVWKEAWRAGPTH